MTLPRATEGQPSPKIIFHPIQLQNMPEQIAVLHASWSILDANGSPLTSRTVEFRIRVAMRDAGALAAAQQMLVERLARTVADAVAGL